MFLFTSLTLKLLCGFGVIGGILIISDIFISHTIKIALNKFKDGGDVGQDNRGSGVNNNISQDNSNVGVGVSNFVNNNINRNNSNGVGVGSNVNSSVNLGAASNGSNVIIVSNASNNASQISSSNIGSNNRGRSNSNSSVYSNDSINDNGADIIRIPVSNAIMREIQPAELGQFVNQPRSQNLAEIANLSPAQQSRLRFNWDIISQHVQAINAQILADERHRVARIEARLAREQGIDFSEYGSLQAERQLEGSHHPHIDLPQPNPDNAPRDENDHFIIRAAQYPMLRQPSGEHRERSIRQQEVHERVSHIAAVFRNAGLQSPERSFEDIELEAAVIRRLNIPYIMDRSIDPLFGGMFEPIPSERIEHFLEVNRRQLAEEAKAALINTASDILTENIANNLLEQLFDNSITNTLTGLYAQQLLSNRVVKESIFNSIGKSLEIDLAANYLTNTNIKQLMNFSINVVTKKSVLIQNTLNKIIKQIIVDSTKSAQVFADKAIKQSIENATRCEKELYLCDLATNGLLDAWSKLLINFSTKICVKNGVFIKNTSNSIIEQIIFDSVSGALNPKFKILRINDTWDNILRRPTSYMLKSQYIAPINGVNLVDCHGIDKTLRLLHKAVNRTNFNSVREFNKSPTLYILNIPHEGVKCKHELYDFLNNSLVKVLEKAKHDAELYRPYPTLAFSHFNEFNKKLVNFYNKMESVAKSPYNVLADNWVCEKNIVTKGIVKFKPIDTYNFDYFDCSKNLENIYNELINTKLESHLHTYFCLFRDKKISSYDLGAKIFDSFRFRDYIKNSINVIIKTTDANNHEIELMLRNFNFDLNSYDFFKELLSYKNFMFTNENSYLNTTTACKSNIDSITWGTDAYDNLLTIDFKKNHNFDDSAIHSNGVNLTNLIDDNYVYGLSCSKFLYSTNRAFTTQRLADVLQRSKFNAAYPVLKGIHFDFDVSFKNWHLLSDIYGLIRSHIVPKRMYAVDFIKEVVQLEQANKVKDFKCSAEYKQDIMGVFTEQPFSSGYVKLKRLHHSGSGNLVLDNYTGFSPAISLSSIKDLKKLPWGDDVTKKLLQPFKAEAHVDIHLSSEHVELPSRILIYPPIFADYIPTARNCMYVKDLTNYNFLRQIFLHDDWLFNHKRSDEPQNLTEDMHTLTLKFIVRKHPIWTKYFILPKEISTIEIPMHFSLKDLRTTPIASYIVHCHDEFLTSYEKFSEEFFDKSNAEFKKRGKLSKEDIKSLSKIHDSELDALTEAQIEFVDRIFIFGFIEYFKKYIPLFIVE